MYKTFYSHNLLMIITYFLKFNVGREIADTNKNIVLFFDKICIFSRLS